MYNVGERQKAKKRGSLKGKMRESEVIGKDSLFCYLVMISEASFGNVLHVKISCRVHIFHISYLI